MILDPVVTFAPAELGYCSLCGFPRPVSAMAVRGWLHRVLICALCLAAAATRIDNSKIEAATPPAEGSAAA